MALNPIEILSAHRFLTTSTARYCLDYGGRGSGKSVGASQSLIEQLINKKGVGLGIRKVGRTLRLSIWPRLLSELRKWGIFDKCKINKTDMSIVLPNGSEIICLGLDDPEKIKSIEGASLAWIEEADSLTEQDFDAIDFSLRQGGDKIIMTFNPPPLAEGVQHWIKNRWIDQNFPNSEVRRTTWKDNQRFLPKDYIERLLSLEKSNPDLYRMWALGEFVGLSGAIFKNYDIQDPPENAKLLGYGLDFGFADDPLALIAVYQAGQEVYLEELIYSTGLTNQDLIQELRDLGINRYSEIIADSAEPKSIEELHRAGFNVKPAIKGQDSVRQGIGVMQSIRLHISKNSDNLKKEFASYCWRRDKSGRALPVPIDAWNHGIDAARYRITYNRRSVKGGIDAATLGV